jgi:hypothetical protein
MLSWGCTIQRTDDNKDGSAAAVDGPSSCGVSFYQDQTCQAWLDTYCCAQEKACDVACRGIIACVARCPIPRTEACVSNCTPAVPNAQLNAIADCSKSAPPPQGAVCVWP